MKKLFIALTIFAVLSMTSCINPVDGRLNPFDPEGTLPEIVDVRFGYQAQGVDPRMNAQWQAHSAASGGYLVYGATSVDGPWTKYTGTAIANPPFNFDPPYTDKPEFQKGGKKYIMIVGLDSAKKPVAKKITSVYFYNIYYRDFNGTNFMLPTDLFANNYNVGGSAYSTIDLIFNQRNSLYIYAQDGGSGDRAEVSTPNFIPPSGTVYDGNSKVVIDWAMYRTGKGLQFRIDSGAAMTAYMIGFDYGSVYDNGSYIGGATIDGQWDNYHFEYLNASSAVGMLIVNNSSTYTFNFNRIMASTAQPISQLTMSAYPNSSGMNGSMYVDWIGVAIE